MLTLSQLQKIQESACHSGVSNDVTDPSHIRRRNPGVSPRCRHHLGQTDRTLDLAADALLSRGMMGDGTIDVATIGTWVRGAGYTGDIKVEIFNREIWDADDDVLARKKDRYTELVLPYA